MFRRLFGAQKWFVLSIILLALVMSTAYAVATIVQTFKDPAYTFQNSTFAQDETVYSKLATNPSGPNYFIEYWQLDSLNLLLKKGPLAVDASGELKDSYRLDYYQEPGSYSIKFLNNPQYNQPFRAIIDSPTSGVLPANSPVTYSFYLIDRENQIIKQDISTSLNVVLQESVSTLPPSGPMASARLWNMVFDENPISSSGWSFDPATGIYSKNVIGFNPDATVRFRVAGIGAEQLQKIDPVYKPEPTNLQGPIEQEDKFFMGAIPETLVYQTVNSAESYPYKVQIVEPNQQVTANPLTISFKLFDSTYQNQIADSTDIQFIITAKEADDYDVDTKQTVIQGSMPIFADGYWRSQLSLSAYGKYKIEVKAKNIFWPKDSVVVNYPANADFKVVDIRPPITSFSINPANPDGLNGWYLNPATITLTPDEKATTYFNWDNEPEQTYLQPISSIEGSHLLNYYSIDRFNNVGPKKSQEIKVDTKNPIISEEAPQGLINDNKPNISARLADESSDINQSSIELKLDNLTVGTSFDTATGKLTYIPSEPISEGSHQVDLAVSDLAGNKASSGYSFEVRTDQEAPIIKDTKPSGVIYSFKPTIEAILEDLGTGVDETSIDLKIDGVKVADSYDVATGKLAYTPSSNLTYGRHQVDLTVADRAGNSASASWRFIIIGTKVSGLININTTWEADASPYIVEGDVYVDSGVTLIIEPGTVVKFNQSKSLTNYGYLEARGTADNKITFTSSKNDIIIGDTNLDGNVTSPVPGDWGKIDLRSSSLLDNVVVNYGGYGSLGTILTGSSIIQNSAISNSSASGIYVSGAYNPQVLNNQIDNNKGSGIYVYSSSSSSLAQPSIIGNIISNNGSQGLYLYQTLPVLKDNSFNFNKENGIYFNNTKLVDLATNNATGNSKAGVRVASIATSTDIGTVNLPASISTYVFDYTLWIDSASTLNIKPGSVLKFTKAGYYTAGFNVQGKLNAVGTADDKIYFTSLKDDSVGGDTNEDGNATSPASGDWGEINLSNTTSEIDNLVINYGGYGTSGAIISGSSTIQNSTISNSESSAIYAGPGTKAQILNNTIENNKGNGIEVGRYSSPGLYIYAEPTIIGNTVKDNNGSGIYLNYARPITMEANDISSNQNYGIYATNLSEIKDLGKNAGFANTPGGAYFKESYTNDTVVNFPKYFSPYVISSYFSVDMGDTLNIEPGTVIKMQAGGYPGARLSVSGTLNALGTPIDKIYFTSIRDDDIAGDTNKDSNNSIPKAGDWGNIELGGQGSNVINNAVIRYGGNWKESMIWGYSLSALNISNSLVSDSSRNGIKIDNIKEHIVSNNRIERTGSFSSDSAIYAGPGSQVQIIDNTIENNQGNGIQAGQSPPYGPSAYSEPVISGNIVSNNKGNGLYLLDAKPQKIELNNFSDNNQYGIDFEGKSYLVDLQTNSAVSNVKGGVKVGSLGNWITVDEEANMPKSMSPYVVAGLYVDLSGALSIKPGAIVKFQKVDPLFYWQKSAIWASGDLDIQGTEEEKVYLTSLADDNIGGDTNLDGISSSASSGDWDNIILEGSRSVIKNSVIKYGGTKGITGRQGIISSSADSSPIIENNVISNSASDGIYVSGSSKPQINSNLIEQNASYGINVAGFNSVGSPPSIVEVKSIANNQIKNNANGINGLYSKIIKVEKNNFVGNSQYPIFLQNGIIDKILQNTGSDNGYDLIYLNQSELDQASLIDGKDSLPFYILGDIFLPSGRTVAVRGGTIFKFAAGGAFNIYGTMNAWPTEIDPQRIYLTSIKDDSIGGDTNNDGFSTIPASGDWNGLSFVGGSDASVLKHAQVRYGSGGSSTASVNTGANIKIDDVIVDESVVGLSINGASPTITNSTFSNSSVGVKSTNTSVIGQPLIQNNTFKDNSAALLLSSASGQVIDNYMTNNYVGIENFSDSFAFIANNIISANTTGISTSSYANFYYNTIAQNNNGVIVYAPQLFSTIPTFTANAITNNLAGIYAFSKFNGSGNQITSNEKGIFLATGLQSASIKSNNISNNQIGVFSDQSSFYLIGNNVSSNIKGAQASNVIAARFYGNSFSNNNTSIATEDSTSDVYAGAVSNSTIGVELNGASKSTVRFASVKNNNIGVLANDSTELKMIYDEIQQNNVGVEARRLAKVIVNKSNIYANSSYNIANNTGYTDSNGNEFTPILVDARKNYWNTLDYEAIKATNKGPVDASDFLRDPVKLGIKSVEVTTYNIHQEKDYQDKSIRNSFVNKIAYDMDPGYQTEQVPVTTSPDGNCSYNPANDPNIIYRTGECPANEVCPLDSCPNCGRCSGGGGSMEVELRNASLFGLQEVPESRHNEFVNDIFAHSSYEDGVSYNSILTSLDISISGRQTYNYQTADGSLDGKRSLQEANLMLGDREVTMFNTHLPTDTGDVDRAFQMLSASGTGVIDRVISTSGPVILTGDMNNHYWAIDGDIEREDTTKSVWTNEYSQYQQLKRLESGGFKRGFYLSNSVNNWDPTPYQYDSTLPESDPNYRKSWTGVDYIFYKDLNNNQQVDAEVMTQYRQSDHWPVNVNLKL